MSRSRQAAGTAQPSFLSMQIEDLERRSKTNDMELNKLNVCAASMYGGTATHHWYSYNDLVHPPTAGVETALLAFTLSQNPNVINARLSQRSATSLLSYCSIHTCNAGCRSR